LFDTPDGTGPDDGEQPPPLAGTGRAQRYACRTMRPNRKPRQMTRALLSGLVIASLASACDDPTGPRDPVDIAYAVELDVDFSRMTETDTGLWYEDITIGTGPAVTAGDRVRVLYMGWLANGTLFDSNDDADAPLEFRVGLGQVIPGWDEGLLDMQPGGVRKLVIRPGLGYGSRTVGEIPGNSTLVFTITLLGYQ
jgi:hypothetical protein